MRSFINYYKILGVGRHAGRKDIQSSFRKLAKKFHPDTSELDPETALTRMRILLEAYRILMNEEKRVAYNLRFKNHLGYRRLSYRDSLEKKKHEPYARALLVFYDLLHDNGSEAILNYEEMAGENGHERNLLSLIGFADYLDCIFLLGEEYQKRERFEEAARHYEEAFREDRKWNYFRHFRAEIRHRIRNVYCRHLARDAEPQTAIAYYRKLLEEYDFPKKDRSFFHKKIAEAYCDLNDAESSRKHLDLAFHLKPNLSGTKKILQRLNSRR